ncbi:hypothetical protein QTP88_001647 [Uroleucon formosanum]
MTFFGIFKKNTSIPKIIILIMWIWDSTSEAQENYNITIFPDHKGLYYESHGMIQTSHTTWNLVTYVNIKVLTTNYDKLMTQYIEMETICKQMITNFCNAEIENICNQFLRQFAITTRPYLYEIQINRHNAMLSIEHNSNNKIRNRRGLGGTFKRLINVLYGAYSKIETEFIFKQILELTKNKIQNINLVKEKTRVVQAEILDANHTLQEITEHHQKFENNLRYLQGLTKESIVNINRLELKNKLLEQAFLFEVTLNQYAYETQNLIAIINAALDGKIHTSVITPRKLIQELTEIKISLPMGNSLPIELIPESMPNLFKISEKTIFVQDEYLIFSIEIPLVASKVFNVYRLIPLPILYSTNTVILIKPEVEYLVINNDNEEFFTITGKQWEACVNLGTYKLCKGGQTFHRRSRSNLCEVALLAYQTIPETCKIKLVTLTTPIWDKLMDSNAWLFYTQPTLVTIKKLNQISTGDAYPLPNITEILDQLGKSRYYTTLDLAQGYHQIKMHPDHCHKTAFSTDKGHFEFLRVPFGLKGAPATFQRLMNSVLTGLNGIKAFVYLDDIIIYALNLEDHSRKLKEVFDRLRESNLKLQPSKCSFLRKEVNYLGHVITDKGVRPNPQKIDCVVKFPTPTNAKEIKSFLGLSGYYRRVVPNYGQIAKPLTSLLKKDVPFYWSDICQEAFDKLKAILTKEPLLKYPDFEQPFNLTCDASNFVIGCILSQGPIGNDPLIAYASRTLNKAEQSYNTREKELCAIVWGVKQYRPYLYGQKFNIITDHRALSWLFNVKDPGSRLIRWRLKLEEYEYEIHYKPGANNTNADALSRIRTVTTRSKTKSELLRLENSSTSTNYFDRIENTESPEISNPLEPPSNTEPSDDYQLFLNTEAKPTTNVIELTGNIFDSEPTTSIAQCISADFSMSRGIALQMRRKFGHVNKLRQEQKSVNEVAVIPLEQRTIFYLITKEHHWQKSTYKSIYICLQKLKELCMELKITNLACPRIGRESDGLQWEIIRNMLQNTFRNSNIKVCVYIREELTEDQKIRELHENPLGGHHGLTRTFNKFYEEHNWKGMRKQIKQFIRHCPDCQKNKTATRTPKEPMVITSTATRAFEKIFLDVVGPLPRTHSGNSFILTLQDDLTKFAWASPMENHEANTVAQHFVTKFVCLHGIPQSLVTDCGTEFLSNVFKEVCKLLKIRQTSTTPYHPQSNGSLERSHRSLAEYLRDFIGKDELNWDTRIPYAIFCHNSTVHSATKFQPYHLVYGNSVKIPTPLTNEPEPQYNYNDYQYEVKRQMQEAQALARSNLLEAKSKSKKQYDKTAKHQSFEVGQKVLLQEKAPKNKLAPKWLGPYKILEVDPTNKNVTIKKSNKKNQNVHQNLLKLFHENETRKLICSRDSL